MRNYTRLNGIVKGLSTGLVPRATTVLGTVRNMNETSLDKPMPMVSVEFITLTESFTGDNAGRETGTLNVGFWMNDTVDSSAEQKQNILESMDYFSSEWIEAAQEVKGFGINSVIREPSFCQWSAYLSGFITQMEIVVGGCPLNPDITLDEYAGEISRKINPINWNV